MAEEDRRGFDNLLILCYRHHVETHDAREYPVEVLVRMKQEHERSVAGTFEPDAELVKRLAMESERYWMAVELANTVQSPLPEDVRVRLPTDSDIPVLLDIVRSHLTWLDDTQSRLSESSLTLPDDVVERMRVLGYDTNPWQNQPYYLDPTVNRDWEILNLGISNVVIYLRMLVDLVELRHLELAVIHSSEDKAILDRLEALRTSVLAYASSLAAVD